jgi:hypothetical protein
LFYVFQIKLWNRGEKKVFCQINLVDKNNFLIFYKKQDGSMEKYAQKKENEELPESGSPLLSIK